MSVPAARRLAVRTGQRCFHTSSPKQGSPFFALAALSNSRETRHLNKLSKLSRVQHSPSLQLIQSSEVFPFASPPSPPVPQDVALVEAASSNIVVQDNATPKAVDGLSDPDILSVGRAILSEKNDEIAELRKTLAEERDRSSKREASYVIARQKARERIQRLSEDASSARTWKWFLLFFGGAWLTWTYSQENVKKAFEASSLKGLISSSKPQQTPPVVQIKAVEKPAVVAAVSEPMPVGPPIKKPTPSLAPPATKPTPSLTPPPPETRSWPSIFWARRD